MLDIRLITEDKEKTLAALKARNFKDIAMIDEILALSEKRKKLIVESENTRFEQNTKSKEMPVIMKNGTDAQKAAIKEELKNLADKYKDFQPKVKEVEDELNLKLMMLPNIISADTPIGTDSEANPIVKVWGEKPAFDFKPKEHDELAGPRLDFERGVKLAHSRFVVYSGQIAKLERALINFMLDVHTLEHGYTEILPPFLVNRKTMTGTGQLPKFEEDLFKTTDDLFLIPTAEVPVTNLHQDEILNEDILPLKYTAYTPCFRKEAGSAGRDTKGIIRQHQFNKVELVKFSLPERSDEELASLLDNAETILRKLGLHYRVVRLCSGDVGFSSAKTFDIEVWMPGQALYREISSCSSFTDFQARRAGIRFKRKDGKKTEFVHTINGSGLAVGRTVVAILENFQRADGTIVVPQALKPYMSGIEIISPA